MKSSPSETSPAQGTSIEASTQVEPNKELIPLSKASQRCYYRLLSVYTMATSNPSFKTCIILTFIETSQGMSQAPSIIFNAANESVSIIRGNKLCFLQNSNPSLIATCEFCSEVVETELMRQSLAPPSEMAGRPPATFNQ
ncbi:hypothetical protein H5410_048371 [Solanum commersonii]|uniref:Uncharacterized protein n=1 Tax=Solanum commersonii TaxID=4109 RepID=A0A9J5XHW6_SOLCO|nr:hypothetical protein H5410_048371 [Solanum commersonii]